jgi:hypothetical protein
VGTRKINRLAKILYYEYLGILTKHNKKLVQFSNIMQWKGRKQTEKQRNENNELYQAFNIHPPPHCGISENMN